MTTSRLYDSTLAALRQHLPDVRTSQLDSLALVMVGIARSQSGHLGKIARNLPLPTRQDSKEQRVRRLIANPRITPRTHYQPVVRAAIASLVRQPIHLVLDRVLLHDRHNLLVVGLATRRRVVPLVWARLDHVGSSDLAQQQAIIAEALDLLPATRRVTLHADSEFRSQELFAWLVAQGCDAFLGLRGTLGVATSADGPVLALQERVRADEGIVYFNEVRVGAERIGPVNLYAWWSKNDRGEPILRAVQTTRRATPHSYRVGKRRMWIEPTFRDWQSGGFGLDTSGLMAGARLEHLLIPLLLVYLWFVRLGRWLTQRGLRQLVDDGPPRVRSGEYGLYQRGVAWFERQLSLELPPPKVAFEIAR